eukprot:1443231-Lingulodinium_polyedra.AAC.1
MPSCVRAKAAAPTRTTQVALGPQKPLAPVANAKHTDASVKPAPASAIRHTTRRDQMGIQQRGPAC